LGDDEKRQEGAKSADEACRRRAKPMFTFVAAGAPRREFGEFVFADDCGKKNTGI
jgi:hypothetical protein